MTDHELTELKRLLTQALALLDRAEQPGEPDLPPTYRLAHELLTAREAKGAPLTVGEAREILRGYYGDKIRGAAANFGAGEDSNHILHRLTPYGQRARASDPVDLTNEGLRRASKYRATKAA